MKRRTFTVAFAALSLMGMAVGASVPVESEPGTLATLLSPKTSVLDPQGFVPGVPVYAYQIDFNQSLHPDRGTRVWQNAYYLGGGLISTNAKEQDIRTDMQPQHQEGEQVVVWVADGFRYQVSKSMDWTAEKINGVEYVVHQHYGFRVYTTADTQFIIGD